MLLILALEAADFTAFLCLFLDVIFEDFLSGISRLGLEYSLHEASQCTSMGSYVGYFSVHDQECILVAFKSMNV